MVGRYSDPSIWSISIPQTAWDHNAVRHSLIATSLVDEATANAVRNPTRNVSALYHLNRAIRSLLAENPPVEVTLMTALLLQLLETLNHNAAVALIHVRSGMKILDDYNQKVMRGDVVNPAQAEFILGHIQPVFQLAAVFAEATLQPAVNSNAERVEQHSEELYVLREKLTRPGVVDSFRGLVDARNNVGGQAVKLTQAMARCTCSSDQARNGRKSVSVHQLSEKEFTAAQNRLDHCKRLFKPIQEVNSTNTTVRMLSIHLKIIEMLIQDWKSLTLRIQTADPLPPPLADDYDIILSELLSLLTTTPLRALEDFKIELGILPPLFYLATSSRHDISSSTRRRAIEYLETYLSERNEGVWSGATASRLAREILEIGGEFEREGFGEMVGGVFFEIEEGGELWMTYNLANVFEHEEKEGSTAQWESESQTQRRKCPSWSTEEIARLPSNINEVVRNVGYQGYFADAVASAKSSMARASGRRS
jgi:hypothetical protein